ncbi:MAG: hypothetical protein Q4D90_05295 [bacterium]|nr:hypothetical protein [bacterium]
MSNPEANDFLLLLSEKEGSRKKGFQEGMQQGILEGIYIFIQDNIEEGTPPERIIEKLQKRFSLSEEEAVEYLAECFIND